jgi:N6-L-threonylcarbamoyladenine synthase
MRVLAIETSCDETGVAIVEAQKNANGISFTVLGAALLSQAALHAQYGGVFPNLAKREHEKNLPVMLEEALQKADMLTTSEHGLILPNGRITNLEVDYIAVTHGPGLEPTLWSGINFAENLAKESGKPLVGINHMEGHLISSLARLDTYNSHILENMRMFELRDVKLPVLALLISGGHTEFVLMKKWFAYEVIGNTLDDAVGEAFDKVARMLGLPYPGGPELSRNAKRAREKGHESFAKLPRPMITTNNCDVSFSGLKTAALYALRDKGGVQNLSQEEKDAFAREFEDTVADVLVAKTRRALTETYAETFVIGGGVAANSHIRERLQTMIAEEFPNVEFRLPELSITGDNAIMIAQAALVRALENKLPVPSEPLRAVGNLSIAS